MRVDVVRSVCLVALAALAGCSSPGAVEEGAPAERGRLTNADWEYVAESPSRYLGADVALTGRVFNVLGSYDGAFHFQMYTAPAERRGNTHVAVLDQAPAVGVGDEVAVVGRLEKELVTSSVAGTELRVPYVVTNHVSAPTATEAGATPGLAPAETVVPETPPAAASPTPAPTESAASPTPAAALPLLIEAEAGQAVAPMAVGRDPSASGGAYVATSKSDQGWNGQGTAPGTGRVDLEVDVPSSGQYFVWARLWYEHANANSMWLQIDGQDGLKLGNDETGYQAWKWVDWRDGQPGQRASVSLQAGRHRLTLIGREAGARLDQFVLTDDPAWRPAEATPRGPEAPGPTGSPTAAAATAPAVTPTATTAPRASATATGTLSTRSPAGATASPAPARTAAAATATPRPTATGAPTPATPVSDGDDYVVIDGDTLSGIAARLYGDASQWPRLYEANRDRVTSPGQLQPGQRLRVPGSTARQ